MAGKILTALISTEADQHWSQGRFSEALYIYDTLLSSSPNLTLNTQVAIEAKIRLLRNKLDAAGPQNRNSNAGQAVQKHPSAMPPGKTVVDLRRCARKYYRQGRFADALEHAKELVRHNAADEFCVAAVAGCMIHLYRIEELSAAADRFLTKSFESAKEATHFKRMLADTMAQKGYRKHAAALLGHTNRLPSGNSSGTS
jgi:tetratricopeptide (TPR) repeat protein